MKSKADIIRERLAGLRVLDIGGAGFGGDNAYERELRDAWTVAAKRVTLDVSPAADVQIDLNCLPLPSLSEAGPWDIVTLFDVLEHLEHPVDVLRWVPADRILVSFPNALSALARRMESRGRMPHLYSFTPYTAAQLLRRGGWVINGIFFTIGKWSLFARAVNAMGSLWPAKVATGFFVSAHRQSPQPLTMP